MGAIAILLMVIIRWCISGDDNRYTRNVDDNRYTRNVDDNRYTRNVDDNRYTRNVTVVAESFRESISARQAMQRADDGFHRCLQWGQQNKDEPFNTGSGSCYVDLDRYTSRSSLKDMWRNKSYRGFTFKASDSLSDRNAIDLKVSNSHYSSAFYNYYLKVK